jgi:hypothetical protein
LFWRFTGVSHITKVRRLLSVWEKDLARIIVKGRTPPIKTVWPEWR